MESTTSNSRTVGWLGLDVSSETIDVSGRRSDAAEIVSSATLRKMKALKVPRTREGVVELRNQVEKLVGECDEIRVVMESTGRYSQELAFWLLELWPESAPAIVNPHRIRKYAQSLGIRNKSDKLDARTIACYGSERRPSAFTPPDSPTRTLQSLQRVRQSLVESLAEQNERLKYFRSECIEPKAARVAGLALETVIETLKEQICLVDSQIEKLLNSEQGARLAGLIATYKQVFGVGPVTATTLAAEMGDLSRFSNIRQMTAMAGLSPRQEDSGKTVHRRKGICKQGPRRVRRVLYLAAMTAVKGDNDFADFNQRLVARGKKPNEAFVAVMRKILIVCRALQITGKQYLPHNTTKTAPRKPTPTAAIKA